jgi:hypothetical protein
MLLLSCSEKNPAGASRLITDPHLLDTIRTHVFNNEYIATGSSESNRTNANSRTFNRTFICKVVHKDNAAFDQKLIRDRLDKWIATVVNVEAPVNGAPLPPNTERVIRYRDRSATGEVRYTLEPVPDAKFVVNGQESPGNVQSLDIQISEQVR